MRIVYLSNHQGSFNGPFAHTPDMAYALSEANAIELLTRKWHGKTIHGARHYVGRTVLAIEWDYSGNQPLYGE